MRLGEIDVRGSVSIGRTTLPDFNIDALVVEMVSVENEIAAGPSRSTFRGGGEADDAAAGPEIGGLPTAACFSQKPSSIWSCSTLIAGSMEPRSSSRPLGDGKMARRRMTTHLENTKAQRILNKLDKL